jgi:hypothetical protein
MKIQRTNLLRLGAIALVAMQSAVAAPVTPPSDGDIFLGFRAGGGQGSGVSYIVNIGNDATFRNTAPGQAVNLSTLGADLEATFGANWHSRGDVYWGFFGARNVINPPVYASRAQVPTGTPAADFPALATNARTATKNQIISVVTTYKELDATANNAVAAVQTNASNSGSYNFQITGGTTSFGTLSQWTDIEGNFGAGVSGSALDLFRLSGSSAQGDVVNRLGTFSITSAGAVSFVAAPVINQVTLKQINYAAAEDTGSVTLTFVRSGDLSAASTAVFSLEDGSAEAGTDYTVPAGDLEVSFDAEESEATVVVGVLDRPGYFGNRTFTVSLVSATGGFAVRSPASATVTINDVDPASTLNFAAASLDVNVLNGGGQPNSIVVTVTRAGVTAGSVSAQVSLTGGTLVSGTHFTFTSPQTVSFLSGDVSKTVQIPLTAAAVPGTVILGLGAPQGSTEIGTTSSLTVNVEANPNTDAGVIAFTAATIPVTTAANSVNVTLSRTEGSVGQVTVDVTASSTTLVRGTDYAFTNPTTVTFNDAATTVTTTVPLSATGPGDIVLTLSNPTNAATLGSQSTVTVAISAAPVGAGVLAFAGSEFVVNEEAGVVNIPVVRTGSTAGPVTVNFSTTDGTATSPADFTTLTNFPVTLADGVTSVQVPVSIINDTVRNEANETFTVTLSSPGNGATLGTLTTATVIILDADTSAPSIKLVAPKANAKIVDTEGPQVTVSGTSKDNKGVAKVEVKLNDGEFIDAVLGNEVKGVRDFTLAVTAERGSNTVTVRSTDYRGNVSKDVVRSFVYDDPYPAIAGVYTGLVTAHDEVEPTNSTEGLISIKVVTKGTFTGKLTADSYSLSFSGRIAASGAAEFGKAFAATAELTRKGKTPLTLALQFDLRKGENSHQVTGSVVDGTTVSVLAADRALYTSKGNPTAPLVNTPSALVSGYTVLFKAEAGAASAFPQGDGWATASVSTAGVVKLKGALADGTAITYSGPLSISNELPFYVQLYKRQGSISGPVKFENLATTDLVGENLYWFRPADSKSKVYPAGWPAGITTDLIGSKFVKAGKTDANSLFGFTGSGTLAFTQGLLAETIEKGFSITAANKVTNEDGDKSFALKVAGATGIFSGSFTPPGEKKKPAFKGVVLQKSGEASGFFLSTATATSQGGKVTVAVPPSDG